MSSPALHAALSRRTLIRGVVGATGASLLVRPEAAAALSAPSVSGSFAADYPTCGFSRYLLTYPSGVREGTDYGIVRDPRGTSRPVAWFDNSRGLRVPGTMDRSAAETPRFIRPLGFGTTTDEYWFGASVYLPILPSTATPSQWFSLATPAFGPPFNGTSPLSLVAWPKDRGSVRIILGGDHTNLGWEFTMPTNKWCRIAFNFKFAYGGWARMWVGEGLGGTGWQPVPIKGRDKCPMPTMGRGVNDACAADPRAQANSSRIGAYGLKARVYYGNHVVTPSYSTFLAAMR